MKEVLKTSILLKVICFILLPILCFGIIGSSIVLYTTYTNKNENVSEDSLASIYTTNYIHEMINILEYYQYNKENIKDISNNAILEIDTIYQSGYYNYYTQNNLKFLIIATDGTIFTNINDIENVEDFIQTVKNNDFYYFIKNNNKETNLDTVELIKTGRTISKENIAGIQEFYTYTDYDSLVGYFIKQQESQQSRQYEIDNIINVTQPYATPTLIISIIAIIPIIIYLFWSLGHKREYEGIYLNRLDRIPLEIFTGAILLALSFGIMFVDEYNFLIDNLNIEIVLAIIVSFIEYTILAIAGTGLLKRFKSKTFFKNTITYKLIKFFFDKILPFIKQIFESRSITFKLTVTYGIVCFLSLLFTLGLYNGEGFTVFASFIILASIAIYIIKKGIEFKKLQLAIEIIYKGKEYAKIDEQKFTGEFKKHAKYLNDISGGFSNAIQESLKGERLKTELITNVSHDIKTPLTSIINYVDLLKKEDLDNPKAIEYLDVLENKSNRLKKLTEDLIEASKVTSGNIKLDIQKINITELITQLNAEFEEKFKTKSLEIITDIPDEEFIINVDGKYMYRILENLYSNILKYALASSRVYIDVVRRESKIFIYLKNISSDKLNISVDELMQRFTRGDISRTTEGSGLGLSIARSLTELQGGKFNVVLDGDLFKVVLVF